MNVSALPKISPGGNGVNLNGETLPKADKLPASRKYICFIAAPESVREPVSVLLMAFTSPPEAVSTLEYARV